MHRRCLLAAALALIVAALPHALRAETLKIASPIRGSWEGAIPELGKQAGIFQKHGLDLEILYTQGGGETLQAVVSGSVDIGLSAGTLGTLGAYSKGAPVRIIAASSTGSRELFWWVPARSPFHSMREMNGQTIRVQIMNAQMLAAKKDAVARYLRAYDETVDWMYSSPDAVPRYLVFSGLSEPAVRLMLAEFIPKDSLQTRQILGLDESVKDAVQFKFIMAPLNENQLKELIQLPESR